MKEIELPDGSIAEFPDNMPDSEIEAVLAREFQAEAPPIPGVVVPEREFSMRGIGSAASTLATGAIAEPLAGLAGIVGATMPGGGAESGAGAVEAVRSGLTASPGLEGQAFLQGVTNQIPQPIRQLGSHIAEGFRGLQDEAGEVSPLFGAAVATAPTLAMEAISVGAARGLLKRSRPSLRAGGKALLQDGAVPSINELKSAARGLYQQLEAGGLSIKPQQYRRLMGEVTKEALRRGLDPGTTPKSMRALARMQELLNDDVGFQQMDIRRTIARNAARDVDSVGKATNDAAIGSMIVEKMDDFLDNLPIAQGGQTAVQYRTARELWGRARRSELIEEAFFRAENTTASGFENGIRQEFSRLIRNPKSRKLFSAGELKAMNEVSKGSRAQNLFKFLGGFGLSDGRNQPLMRPLVGSAAAGAVFGPGGAIALPLIGTVSKRLAARMTEGSARMADAMIRAGKDSRRIAAAYLQNTPRRLRDPRELAQLLMKPGVDPAALAGMGEFTDSAIRWSRTYADAAATAATAATQGAAAGPPSQTNAQ